ncbi:MAG: carboxypeptidase-like regulatory domain-containing protein, partial [candidate division WOR-3 bacterium]
ASQITGRIFDSATGEPLSAEVRILECYAPPETILPRFSDRESGRFSRLLNPGRYTIQVLKDGYEVKTETCDVFFGQPTEINFYLRPSGIEERGLFQLKNEDDGKRVYTPDGRLVQIKEIRRGIYFLKEMGKTKKIISY